MQRCPQCHLLNPERYQFCQQCGASLTQQNCPGCGQLVELSVLTCPHCSQSIPPLHAQVCAPVLAGAEVEANWSEEEVRQSLALIELDLEESWLEDSPGSDQSESTEILNNSEDLSDVPTMLLPNQLVHLEAKGYTDVGRKRHHNEDYFIIDQQATEFNDPSGLQLHAQGIYILCDGMGGHASGEVASALAAKTLLQDLKANWQDELPSEASLKEAIFAANQAIYATNEAKGCRGSDCMGTTLVMALVKDTQVCIAHVGDSRLYRVTQQHGLEQLTIDHEVGQRSIQRGIEPDIAYARSDAYQLTQALGPKPEHSIRPDIQTLTVTEDTLFLLCSDGLTDNDLLETHASSHLMPLLDSGADVTQGATQLINLANQHNGHDNVTVIAIRMRVQQQSQPRSSC